ncbi:MAG: orotate phosphoribosyltransferase [Lachnospiraceae bacterium]|nr:orotate phosphoribosyltransferase [Lachnospiraceae bacterium]
MNAGFKESFVTFMAESGVLQFGDFTLKSGRRSPFYVNTGAFVSGSQLNRLGAFYARAIEEHYGPNIDVIFGPAYKGIPLSIATVTALHTLYGREVRFSSNRKEMKDHGDAGVLLGSGLNDGDRVLLIEDVTTSGSSIDESVPLLKSLADVEIVGLIIALDRGEKGPGGKTTALEELRQRYGFRTHALVSMDEAVEFLSTQPVSGRVLIDEERKRAIARYYEEYGIGH